MRVKKYSVSLLFVVLTLCVLTLFSFAVDPPEGSEILEYIESSGTQFIDTLVLPTVNTKIFADVEVLGSYTNNVGVFGSRNSDATSMFELIYIGSAGNFANYIGTAYGRFSGVSIGRLDISFANGSSVVNGATSNAKATSLSPVNTIYISSVNDGTPADGGIKQCIYSFDIYNSDSQIRDYVPLRTTDGQVGLWDYVDGTFYPNVGTGSFTAGPVVEVVEPENPEYSITVHTEGSGTASASSSSSIAGETITLTATPADGSIFSGWEVVSGDVTISNNQFVMPAEDVVIKATFTDDPNIFSITVTSDGNGTASSSVVSAEQGAQISLTATPNAGYQLKQWNVLSGGVSISNDSFTMPAADVEIQAVFEPIIYTITVTQSPNGTASASADTGIIGDTVYLTATPAKGYVFNYWEFSPAIVTATDNQFIMPAANITVKPVFVEQSAISSGFTYNSGILTARTRSTFDTADFSFGEQIAGSYIINIYHWGDSYDVNFYIYDSNEKYYPVTTAGGCSTFIYNHSGGTMAFDGSFSIVNTDTTAVDGWYQAVGGIAQDGEIDFYPPLSWTFNIENIVAVPLEIAQDSDFGIYSLIVGFLRNQFTDMKSFLAEQFEKISGTDDTQADVDSAADELNKEVEDLNNLSGELDNQASSLEQQFTTDFKVPDEISGNASNFQLIYTGIFQSLGIFSVFIWLPVVFAVIKKLLRL